MKTLNILSGFILMSVFLTGCLKGEGGDRGKNVVMTVYPETGYGASVMSDLLTQPLFFSDSDDSQKRMMVDIITEGIEFNYERGYEFTLKVKKVWMHEPPQDVSSIKYVFIELLTKKKLITDDSEKNIELFVSSETVRFTPKYPAEYEENGAPKIYDALYVKQTGDNNWMALTDIEGFDFEEGCEYVLNVKKVTQADPYSVKYILLNILSKNKVF